MVGDYTLTYTAAPYGNSWATIEIAYPWPEHPRGGCQCAECHRRFMQSRRDRFNPDAKQTSNAERSPAQHEPTGNRRSVYTRPRQDDYG